MLHTRFSHSSLAAGALALRLAAAVLSPVITASPALALAPQLSPLDLAQQREGLTGGGVFDPNVVPPFSRPDSSGVSSFSSDPA
jgi:hypothetical protein